MAIKLMANYAKRLGLPGFSSHQFSVSVETELHNGADIGNETQRLYTTLQNAVDEQIQATGFVPPDSYGLETKSEGSARNGSRNGNGTNRTDRDFAASESRTEIQ